MQLKYKKKHSQISIIYEERNSVDLYTYYKGNVAQLDVLTYFQENYND